MIRFLGKITAGGGKPDAGSLSRQHHAPEI
jgi:hypothetical protein